MSDEFYIGLFTGVFALLVGLGVAVASNGEETRKANMRCQSLGYSAGHVEEWAGLVCEQWIEAAKVTPK